MVDTFSKFSAGLDENDNTKVAAYLAMLAEYIRDAFHCTVLLDCSQQDTVNCQATARRIYP